MAKLKSKVEEVIEDVKEAVEDLVEDLAPVSTVGDIVDEYENANTTILEDTTRLVSKKFDLGNDYSVTKFESKGNQIKLALENADFVVNVTVKDRIKYGLFNQTED